MRFTLAALALAATSVVAAPLDVDVDADLVPAVSSAKFCDAALKVCFAEWVSPQSISFRVALSDSATKAPFDVLLSIVAPKATGWAGVAWGGQMSNNPLTIGWANGASTVVSSRLATGHTLPGVYAGASYTMLPTSVSNSTHWRLDVLCSGCSSWTAKSLDPTAATVTLAYGMANAAPAQPANNASRFSAHSSKGKFTLDLASGRTANFDSLVKSAIAGTSGASPAAPAAPAPPAPAPPNSAGSNASPSQVNTGPPAAASPASPPPPPAVIVPVPAPAPVPIPVVPMPPNAPSAPPSVLDSPYSPAPEGEYDGWEWVYEDEDEDEDSEEPYYPGYPRPPIGKKGRKGKKGIPFPLKKKKGKKVGRPFGKKGRFYTEEDES